MNDMWICIKKDRKEFIRSRRNMICVGVLILCASFVLCSSLIIPPMLNQISMDIISNELMETLFPKDLSSSIGLVASQLGVFYGCLAIIIAHGIIPDEIENGKILFSLSSGYKKEIVVLSKVITNSIMISLPVMAIYMIYFFVGSNLLNNNMLISTAILNGFALAIAIFATVLITMSLSMFVKNKYVVLITMLSILIFVPDAFSFVEFGRYMPTYLFTFAYNTSSKAGQVVIPIIELMIICTVLLIYGVKRGIKVVIDNRMN